MATTRTRELYVGVTGYGLFGDMIIEDDDDRSLPCVNIIINFYVEQTYHSSDGSPVSITGGCITKDVIGQFSSQYPYHSLTNDIISTMIAEMDMPFPFEKMHCYSKPPAEAELESMDDLISHILEVALSTGNRFPGSGQKIFGLKVQIENRVILSRHEIQAMSQAKVQEERAEKLHCEVHSMIKRNPSWCFRWIHRDIRRIVRDTAPTEKAFLDKEHERDLELSLLEQAMKEFFPALETMRFEGDDREEQVLCAICLNDIFIGSRLTRMPCSHRYHVGCIAEWLKRSLMCPMCRLNLSPTNKNTVSPMV